MWIFTNNNDFCFTLKVSSFKKAKIITAKNMCFRKCQYFQYIFWILVWMYYINLIQKCTDCANLRFQKTKNLIEYFRYMPSLLLIGNSKSIVKISITN